MTTITGTAILIESLQYTITNTSSIIQWLLFVFGFFLILIPTYAIMKNNKATFLKACSRKGFDQISNLLYTNFKYNTIDEDSNNMEIIMDSDICLSSTNNHLLISGLVNTGNSCFLNSVLQSLSSLPKLHSYLHQINQKTASLFISKPLLKTLRLLSRPSNTAFKPSELVSILSNCLINKEQQDAQELFQLISTTLDNENQFARRQQGLSSLLSSTSTSKLPESPFTGLLANRLSCMQCGYTEAIRHFSFNNVQLTLPDHAKTTLEDCLHQLTAMEFLNDVICRKCTLIETIRHTNTKLEQNPSDQILLNTKQELEKRLSMGLIEQEKEAACTTKGVSSKQAMFAKSPKILCLHTARSSLDLSTGEIYKNTCQVEFPEILDLSPYCTNGVLNTTDPHLPISSPLHTAVPIKYRLMSIVVHYGSHDYGHFIAYKRRLIAEKCHCTSCSDDQTVLKHHESNWFKISDEHVEACTLDDVLSANPYMLLYEMVEEEQVSDIETEEEEEEEEEHWIQQPIAPPSSPLLAPLQKASCSFYKPLSNPQRRSSKSLWTEAPTAVC